jgi:hypothetical protein
MPMAPEERENDEKSNSSLIWVFSLNLQTRFQLDIADFFVGLIASLKRHLFEFFLVRKFQIVF